MNNKKFKSYSGMFLILGVIWMFFYAGLQNDHLNVITPYLTDMGLSSSQITAPVFWAGLACVAFYLICGILFIKLGVRVIMVPFTIILGAASIGLAYSTDNYILYFICLFLVRLSVVPLQMGGFMLCANWFIKYRGRVMGIITAGSPLFSVFGIVGLTKMVNGMGFQTAYTILGAVVIIVALLTWFGTKDKPEDCGLYPDGSDTAPASVESDEEDISLGEILKDSRAWKLIISYGILQFVIVCMMAFMASRYIMLGGPELWVGSGLKWLSVGAILGIPMSYVLGYIDDKLGSIKASLVLNILYFVAVIPLTIMPAGGNTALMICWAFGVACMTGGCPTMHPCITSYVYGRKLYQAANKWIMTIQAIIMSFATVYMSFFFDRGLADYAYYGLIILLIVSFIAILSMRKIPDANYEDRDYIKK